jgi:protein tyrosine phosphatase
MKTSVGFSFQLVTTYHPGKSQYSTALRVTNQPKNRSPDYLSSDSSRVFLSPIVDVEGEDYINASWISGKKIPNFTFIKIYNL